ncbi:MAG TPA: hypothetical protein VHZ02_10905 [Acidimicrobiales bacterium]|jgi:hypothetical protein|nr:hypothetical protein [Acidimicrobiales bacterium]
MKIEKKWMLAPMAATLVGLAVTVTPLSVSGTGIPASATMPAASATPTAPIATESSCTFGNPNVHHVVQVTFDNVHFNRDNPNVLSDMEQLPALKNFIEDNGTLLSNSHTPLIAHTANDTISNYTGLYGDRNGIGVSNDYGIYNSGSASEQGSFNYWTAPSPAGDGFPAQPYSTTSPAAGGTTSPPPPWSTFASNGCDTAGVSTANMELENVSPDITTVFGSASPEQAQVNNDPDAYKDQETNDYLGLAVHCAAASPFCANATAVKYGQSSPTPSAAPDQTGYQAVFGAKYLQPAVKSTISALPGATTTPTGLYGPSGHQVTDAAGNLVDLFGNEIDGQYASTPGFPGFGGITAAQSLAYTADLQEAGVPVTYAYISDLHEKKYYASGSPTCTTAGAGGPAYKNDGAGLGPADPCYTYNASQYNAAFADFFARLAADGITPANTEFVFNADEGDHFNGANVGRAIEPTCTGTPGTTNYSCSYPTGSVGEVDTNIHGLLSAQEGSNPGSTVAFFNEPQGDTVYVNGQPSPTDAMTRGLENAFASARIRDPFASSTADVPLTNFMADQEEEQLLHYVVADPARTPTFTVFPQSDAYLSDGSSDTCSSGTTPANADVNCTSLNSNYLWNHGYYGPEINNTWLGFVGPGVNHAGLNGSDAAAGPNSAGATSGGPNLDTSVDNNGIWADHTDTRPTLLALVGLSDNYTSDGRVLTEIMSGAPAATRSPLFVPLATCYKQLNSSVGSFGTDTLVADTKAIESSSRGDVSYETFLRRLTALGDQRNALASAIKDELSNAEFSGVTLPSGAFLQLFACYGTLAEAHALTKGER